jgi:hypothetical protein
MFCLDFFVQLVNLRIATKLIYSSINVYLDMAQQQASIARLLAGTRLQGDVLCETRPHSSPGDLIVRQLNAREVASGSDATS